MGASSKTVYYVKFLKENADSMTLNMLRRGQISINEAFRRVKSISSSGDGHHSKSTGKTKGSVYEESVATAMLGDNSMLMRNVARLYFKKGFRIADVTYGKGTFWKLEATARARARSAAGSLMRIPPTTFTKTS